MNGKYYVYGENPHRIKEFRRKVQGNLLNSSMGEFFYCVCCRFNEKDILAIVDAYFCIADIDPAEPIKEIDKWDGKLESIQIVQDILVKYIPEMTIDSMSILTKMFYALIAKEKKEEFYACLLPINEALMEASKYWK